MIPAMSCIRSSFSATLFGPERLGVSEPRIDGAVDAASYSYSVRWKQRDSLSTSRENIVLLSLALRADAFFKQIEFAIAG
jgi:hypothetical protein